MFYFTLACGIIIGTFFGISIMCLMIIAKRSDEREYVETYCSNCEIFYDETADTSICFSCDKGRVKNV